MDRKFPGPPGYTGGRRRLQIAILGDTVSGLALGALLQERGFDPVITSNPDRQPPSRVATVWDAGQRIFSALGIETAVKSASRSLERVSIPARQKGKETYATISSSIEYRPPIVVERTDLKSALHERIDADRKIEAGIADLRPRNRSFAVEFDSGVQEGFDLVVDARHPPLDERDETAPRFAGIERLRQHENTDGHHRKEFSTSIKSVVFDLSGEQFEAAILEASSPSV